MQTQRDTWDITLFGPLKVNRRFGEHIVSNSGPKNKLCMQLAFTLASCSVYSSTLNIEAIYSSETSINFERTIPPYIPEIIIFTTIGVRT